MNSLTGVVISTGVLYRQYTETLQNHSEARDRNHDYSLEPACCASMYWLVYFDTTLFAKYRTDNHTGVVVLCQKQ